MVAASQILFDATTHTYTREGVVVPSVTQLLEDVGIINYDFLPEGTRIMALERGRYVHAVCEFDDQGDLGEYDNSLTGYLEAWREFRRVHGFAPRLIEHRGYSPFGFAGTLDRLGTFSNGSHALIDLKTSVVPYWAKFQLAGYASFFDSPARYRRMAVALHEDGTFAVEEYRCSDYSKHLSVILAALCVYNAKRRV